MIRTQICLDPEEARWLKRRAMARGTSMAGVVRHLIEMAKSKTSKPRILRSVTPKQYRIIKKQFPFVGCLKGGKKTDVYRIDEYLYDDENIS